MRTRSTSARPAARTTGGAYSIPATCRRASASLSARYRSSSLAASPWRISTLSLSSLEVLGLSARTRQRVSWPRASSSLSNAPPSKPVAPVRSILIRPRGVHSSLWPSAGLLTALGVSAGLEQSHAASPVTFVPLHILDLRLLAFLQVLQLRLFAAERDAGLVGEPESYRFVALFVYGRPHAEPLSLGVDERDRAKQYLLLRTALTPLIRRVVALLRFGSAVLLRPTP